MKELRFSHGFNRSAPQAPAGRKLLWGEKKKRRRSTTYAGKPCIITSLSPSLWVSGRSRELRARFQKREKFWQLSTTLSHIFGWGGRQKGRKQGNVRGGGGTITISIRTRNYTGVTSKLPHSGHRLCWNIQCDHSLSYAGQMGQSTRNLSLPSYTLVMRCFYSHLLFAKLRWFTLPPLSHSASLTAHFMVVSATKWNGNLGFVASLSHTDARMELRQPWYSGSLSYWLASQIICPTKPRHL